MAEEEKKEHKEHQEHHVEHHPEHHSKKKEMNVWMYISIILGIVLVIGFFTGAYNLSNLSGTMSASDAAVKAMDFLNKNAMPAGMTATYKGVNETAGMYMVTFEVQNQTYSAFITKNGKYFSPQIIDMAQYGIPQTPVQPDMPTAAKAEAELYIFSYCPAGTAALNSFATAAKSLGTAADMKVRFFSDMHGAHELQQNKIQECIQQEAPSEYWDYALKYVETIYPKCGQTRDASCDKNESVKLMGTLGIDSDAVMACVNESGDALYSTDQGYADGLKLSSSPSIVINGMSLGSSYDRSPEGVKTLICSGFETAPGVCSSALSNQTSSATGSC